jgi:hypothetical protein
MANNIYSGWSVDDLQNAIRDAQDNLASLAESVSSPDGTSVRFRKEEEIKQTIQDLMIALAAAQSGSSGRPPRNRINRFGYSRALRWMR